MTLGLMAADGSYRVSLSDGAGNNAGNAAPLNTKQSTIAVSDLTSAVINISTATTTAIVSATASQTTRVHRMRLNIAGAGSVTVQNGGATLEVLNFTGAGFLNYEFQERPWYTTSANTALNFVTSAAVQLNGVVEYIKS